MKLRPIDWLFVAALICGASYYAEHWLQLDSPLATIWKGSGVSLLALWAFARGRPWIGLVLAFGALGDMLLDAVGLEVGAVAFLIGHVLALGFFWRSRRAHWFVPVLGAAAVSLASYLLAGGSGVALYGFGLGAMAGAALVSRFQIATVGLGALLFVVSDLLIFAVIGPMADSPIPGLLIWPTYFAGQALIAWGVVTEMAREGVHDRV
ncbi:lysoplasmalogenase family protein [Sphingomonas soli]|uniref:lysoplasmalogenase family protein n=1 Tax=Sphingomonas soli TaxID=266127 RepID=UPI0009FCDFAA|nr:lysoplasmalogenase family protein [Sphingomonas soli]